MSYKQPHQIQNTSVSSENTEDRLELSSKTKIEHPINYWQLSIAVVALLGLGFVLGQKFQPQGTAKPIAKTQTNILPVKTTVVELVRSYSTSQTYTGEVTALRTSEVGFERGGKLNEVFVEEGDRITTGSPLAKLDTANLEAQRQGLMAQKQQAQAVLAELENGARTEEIAAAQANVRDLQQQLELEKLRSSRREYLYDEGAVRGRTGNRFPILPFKTHHATFIAMRSPWLFGTLFSLLFISRSTKKIGVLSL